MPKVSRPFLALIFALAGCGRSAPQPAVPKPAIAVTQPVVAKVRPTWDPTLVPGGAMIRDDETFRRYVRRSEVVAIGTLTSWDGFAGKLKLERVLHGRAGSELFVRSSGGFVRPKPGERYIVLMGTKKGQFVLNSFCAMSGLYEFSATLASIVENALEDHAP